MPSSSLDEIATSLKNKDNFAKLSKSQYEELKRIFAVNGKNLDEFLNGVFKKADEINFKPQNLINELTSSGKKFTLEDVEFVVKTPSGELLWLEKGNVDAGLQHILNRHANDFAKRGITDIKTFIYNTLEQVPIKKDIGSKGPYAEYIINGKKYCVAYGDNGFIVSFYPMPS